MTDLPDWGPDYSRAKADIYLEATAARERYPAFHSAHEGYAVILEELDELWDDVKANRVELSILEAIQVGAMALRYVADMRAICAKARSMSR